MPSGLNATPWTVAGMPLQGGVAGCAFSLPVVPLPPATLDAALVLRKLLGERLEKARPFQSSQIRCTRFIRAM